MKKTNFTQEGGFPLEEKTLDYMQIAYMQILKAIIGHLNLPSVGNFIITGCEIVGTTITDGILYIDGDLCSFSSTNGNLTTKIAKIETIENAPFENGNNLPTYYDYTAMVNNNGSELDNFERVPKVSELVNILPNWDDITNMPQVVIDPADLTANPPELTVLQRISILEKKNAVFQAGGGMVLWNKPANLIPQGWQEVVDWKGRIPVGVDNRIQSGQFINPEFSPVTAGQNDPGRTGGSKGKTLILAEIPAHDHDVPLTGDYTAGGNRATQGFGDGGTTKTSKAGGLPDGTTKEFSLLNPYRTVLFIEYIG